MASTKQVLSRKDKYPVALKDKLQPSLVLNCGLDTSPVPAARKGKPNQRAPAVEDKLQPDCRLDAFPSFATTKERTNHRALPLKHKVKKPQALAPSLKDKDPNEHTLPASEKIVLSYGGVSLYESDLDSLHGQEWLNDTVIEFAFAMFSSKFTNIDDVLLLPASVITMMKHSPGYLAQLDDNIKMSSYSLVMMIVNDKQDVSIPDSGKHWSLMVLDNTKGVFIHHDSLGNANLEAATDLADLIRGGLPGLQTAQVINAETPQQRNNYDCGIYVMAVAESICRWWSKSKKHDESKLQVGLMQ